MIPRAALFAFLAALAMTSFGFAQAIQASRSKTLRVGVLKPLLVRGTVQWSDDNTFQGYVPELVRAVARETGYEVEFVGLVDVEPIVALRERRVDVVGVVPTIELQTHELLCSTQVLMVRGAAFGLQSMPVVSDADDLRGYRLVVAGAGVAHTWCVENGLEVTDRSSLKLAFDDVLEGRADYLITTQNAGRYEADRFGLEGLREHEIDGPTVWRHYAFAVRHDDTALLADLNYGLSVLRTSGRFDDIYAAWMARWQPRAPPRSLRSRVVVWAVWLAVGVFLAAGLWQWQLRRELARRTTALRESEQKHRAIFENSQDGILIIEPRSAVVSDANQRAATLFGMSRAELIGQPLPRVDVDLLRRGETHIVKLGHNHEGPIWSELSTSRATFGGSEMMLTLVRDVSERVRADDERQRLEAQLVHAQKLEGLGVLAGGIAHDFNNLMVGVMGNVDLALEDLDERTHAEARLRDALRATERASQLTHQLLAYSGRAKFSEEPIDLGAVVAEMVSLLGTSLTDRAKPVLDLDEELPPVLGDATLIRQVTMNLLTNARDALAPTGGRIHVRTGVVECDLDYLRGEFVPSDIAPGEYVFLEIEDDGCGMDEETLSRIFDPFFSTKFTGRGLGLSVVLKTVQRHHGAVKLRSRPGLGTVFRLLFPPARETDGTRSERRTAVAPAQDGRALVVDDDAAVRDVVRRMLEGRGWIVTCVDDGRAALNTVQAGAQFDIVLLDVTMPGVSGFEVLRSLRRLRPRWPIVLMSGYSGEVVEDGGVEPDAFAHKPFTTDTLAQAMDTAIAARRAIGASR